MKDYVAIDAGFSKPRWVLKDEQEKYKLKIWSKNEMEKI
jgi:hypothetical protein